MLIVGLMSDSSYDPEETKVAVIVLDGADWEPINQLREQERVPEIEKTMQKGVYGNLTTPRAFSPITWTKIATGMSEEDTAIKGWNIETEERQRMVRREDVKHKRMWDYLNEAGYKTGVVGWLLTWPVETVDGFMIAGPMRTSDKNLLYPEDEFNETESEIIENSSEWKAAQIGYRRREKVDFLALGMKSLDVTQHHLWKFIEPEPFGLEKKEEHKKYREFVYAEYENLDSLMSQFDEDWNVIVLGDSGFEPEHKEFGYIGASYALSINPLIQRLGYGEFEDKRLGGTVIDEPQPGTQLKRCPLILPMNDIVNKTTLQFRMCVLDENLDVESALEEFRETSYRDGRELFESLEYRPEEEDIIGKMRIYQDGMVERKFRVASTDQPLVDGPIPYIDPALGIELPNGSYMKLWIGPEKSGDHPPRTNSIFLAKGPAFKEGYRIEENELYASDIAPTVLYMYDLPIPEEMKGRPMVDMFSEEFQSQRKLRYTNLSTVKGKNYTAENDPERNKALKKRLRDIGYLVS